MRILFTGASCFTGYWMARELAHAGHDVISPLRGPATGDGLRGRRLALLPAQCRVVEQVPFGSDAFRALATEGCEALCHHAAEVANYKSPDFDALQATAQNTWRLRETLTALRAGGTKLVVLTGTYFEADEGQGEEPRRAFSPYGLSKALTWQVFRHYCAEAGMRLAKFVLPNPFGPLEEPRFTSFLMAKWAARQPAEVRTPDYQRDNLHVDLLAKVYAGFVERVAVSSELTPRLNPSGYAESQGAFAERVAREVRARLGWPCDLLLRPQTDWSEPRVRINTDPAKPLAPDWDEAKAWDAFVEFHAAATAR